MAGPLNWSGGTIKNTVQCNGGTLTNTDNLDGGQLINSGTLGLAGTIYDGAGSVISNASSGTINMTWNSQIYFTFPNFGVPATFYNAGQLNVAAGLGNTGYIEDSLTNSGTVTINSGTLDLGGSGANNGTMSVTSGNAALQVSAGTFNFNSGHSVSDSGNLIFSGGTVNVAGTVSVSGTNLFSGATASITGNYPITTPLVISSGTVNFNGTGSLTPPVMTMSSGTMMGNAVNISGPLNWSGGTIKNTVQCNGGTLTNTDNLDGGQLINSGTLGLAGTIYDGAGSVISNASSGTINMTWNSQIYFTFPNFGVPATFYNAGQLNVAAGLGNTGYIEDSLTNSGTVTINSGTLDLAGGGVNNGTMRNNGYALEFSAGTFNINSGSTVQSGTGQNLIFNGGTVNVAGTVNDSLTTNIFSGATVNITGNYPINWAMEVSSGTLNLNGSGAVSPTTLNMSGGTLSGNLVTDSGPLNWSGGTIKNTVQCNGGTLTNTDNLDGGQLINSGTLGLAGTIYDGAGSVISNASSGTINMTWNSQIYFTFPNFGVPATFYNAGQLNVAAGLGNTGYIEDSLTNSGTISIENGTLSLPQTTNLAGGTLDFGVTNVTSFGSLKLTGPAVLGGTLAATFEDPSFAPAVNNQWTLITYASFSGAFSTVNLPSMAVWQTTASATSYIIKILQLTSVTVITMNPPVLNSNQVQLNFTVNGPASVFQLLQTGRLGTPWSTNATALFTTNTPGSSYRFTTTKGPSNQFYRVQSP